MIDRLARAERWRDAFGGLSLVIFDVDGTRGGVRRFCNCKTKAHVPTAMAAC
ncbi:MAG TPA: hypothetical protein VF221_21355 [Chloroflexota bacterium]